MKNLTKFEMNTLLSITSFYSICISKQIELHLTDIGIAFMCYYICIFRSKVYIILSIYNTWCFGVVYIFWKYKVLFAVSIDWQLFHLQL